MKKLAILAAVAAISAMGLTDQAVAQGVGVGVSVDVEYVPVAGTITYRTQGETRVSFRDYAVKFLCGTVPGATVNRQFPNVSADEFLAPGVYLTAIDIFQLSTSIIQKRIALGDNLPATAIVSVSPTLASFEAVQVDCEEITDRLVAVGKLGSFNPETEIVKGFLTLRQFGNGAGIVVAAVYTVKNIETEGKTGDLD